MRYINSRFTYLLLLTYGRTTFNLNTVLCALKSFIGGAVCREFESEAPAGEVLDRVICYSEQFSFYRAMIRRARYATASQCCCQGLELQGQGQGLGSASIHTFLVGTEQEVMSLVVYCRCHVTDKKQRSALDSEILPLHAVQPRWLCACMPKSLDSEILVTSLTKERRS